MFVRGCFPLLLFSRPKGEILPDGIIQVISKCNSLDSELYVLGERLFEEQQHAHWPQEQKQEPKRRNNQRIHTAKQQQQQELR
jgi:hypothetical protein